MDILESDLRKIVSYRELKSALPKGGAILTTGCLYVAHYFLPRLIKLARGRNVEIDSAIPGATRIQSLLKTNVPSDEVDKALQEECSKPLVKALLSRKSAEEAAAIISEMRDEFERDLWLGYVWQWA